MNIAKITIIQTKLRQVSFTSLPTHEDNHFEPVFFLNQPNRSRKQDANWRRQVTSYKKIVRKREGTGIRDGRIAQN
jgi:hypothetical protein